MNVTLHLGPWIAPVLLTAGLLGWAVLPRADERRSGDYDFAFWLPAAFRALFAVIGALLAWLVWSLFF